MSVPTVQSTQTEARSLYTRRFDQLLYNALLEQSISEQSAAATDSRPIRSL